MNTSSARARVRVDSLAGLLATIPHLLGFTPADSLVVLGVTSQGRVPGVFRYDLPDPPDATTAAEIARHALGVLVRQNMLVAVVAGYGPGTRATPPSSAARLTTPLPGISC